MFRNVTQYHYQPNNNYQSQIIHNAIGTTKNSLKALDTSIQLLSP